jgi:hypothetical protein
MICTKFSLFKFVRILPNTWVLLCRRTYGTLRSIVCTVHEGRTVLLIVFKQCCRPNWILLRTLFYTFLLQVKTSNESVHGFILPNPLRVLILYNSHATFRNYSLYSRPREQRSSSGTFPTIIAGIPGTSTARDTECRPTHWLSSVSLIEFGIVP